VGHILGPPTYSVVFITVQNLVGFAAVVLIVQKFEYFARLAEKCLFTPPCGAFFGKMGNKGHLLHF